MLRKPALAAKWALLAIFAGICSLGASRAEAADTLRADLVNRKVLRVCSDPANMPFSNEKGEGYENKIAEIIADELKIPVEYTWFPQATGFIRQTLSAKRCDVVMGWGQGDTMVLNTNHYLRSVYALIVKPDSPLKDVRSLFDPRLKDKRIGIVAGLPPASLAAKAGLMTKAKPYPLTVDRRYFSPAEQMMKDIRSGEIDAGVQWGPIAGYWANHGGDKLLVIPLLKDAETSRMSYRITLGVRNSDDHWKRQLNEVLKKRQGDIDKVLLEYDIPMLDEQSHLITAPRGNSN
jgi:quinoprotein dehydrogenase-associated probable ABC transporter substrate-binding protein